LGRHGGLFDAEDLASDLVGGFVGEAGGLGGFDGAGGAGLGAEFFEGGGQG